MLENTKCRVAAFGQAALAARPYALGWGILAYYLILIMLTDVLVWRMAGEIGGYSWQQMALYSLFSFPLWMLIGVKGIAREQSDLIEQGRWSALDLMPGGPTPILLGHHVGKTLKTRALWAWMIVYVIVAFLRGADTWVVGIAIAGLVLGAFNLLLAAVLTRFYAPKGYAAVLGAIFYSATAILSGSAFPLAMVTNAVTLRLFNPFASTVSGPLELLLRPELAKIGVNGQLIDMASAATWCLLLLVLCIRAERTQRARIHT